MDTISDDEEDDTIGSDDVSDDDEDSASDSDDASTVKAESDEPDQQWKPEYTLPKVDVCAYNPFRTFDREPPKAWFSMHDILRHSIPSLPLINLDLTLR